MCQQVYVIYIFIQYLYIQQRFICTIQVYGMLENLSTGYSRCLLRDNDQLQICKSVIQPNFCVQSAI